MNDIELLERLRADAPEPPEPWLREARREILAARREPTSHRPLGHRGRRSLPVAAALATSLIVLLASGVLPLGPARPDPAVAGVLRRFAHIARNAQYERPPQPGQYVYWKTREVTTYLFLPGPGLEPFAYEVASTGERWVGLDGSGRGVARIGQPRFLTEADRVAYEAFLATEAANRWGRFEWGRTYETRYGPGELSDPSLVPDLPTDPEALREELERQESLGGSNGDWGVFTWATDLLAVSYMSPQLRAAFYQVMSEIPGTELIGIVEDELGRRGIAIGHTRDGVREEVIFDRQTGDVLASRTVRVENDAGARDEVPNSACCSEMAWPGTEAGTVMFSSVYVVDAQVVDSLDA
jgi:hypothetical protein